MTDRLKAFSADRWRSIEPIIDAALELPAEERRAYVHAACADDASLLAEVEQLLAAHDGPAVDFDTPAAERFASLLDEELRLPEVLGGRYKIGPMLGRGGMATVFLAEDLRHERQVAVKVLHAELAAALGAELFLAEIKTTAQLHHPQILPLHDSGDADGLLYYVMPYVPGGTLRRRLNEQPPLAIDDIVRITAEVASALDAAHRHGVIHRDIKPENILLHEGTALVADFGIALAVSAAAAARVAKPGLILGTRQYMSPEQATKDGAVDGRADVYSLGVVVFEMLAGHLPLDGFASVETSTVAGPRGPSVSASRSEIRGAVDAVIARALSPAAADRYVSAGELAADLRQAVSSTASTLPAWARHLAASVAPIDSGVGDEQMLKSGRVREVGRASERQATRRSKLPFAAGAVFLLAVGGVALMRSPPRAGVHRHRWSTNQQAVDYFNDGQAWIDSRTPRGAARAESSFMHAIAIDSNFADAYAGLAHVHFVYGIGNLGDYEPERYLPEARKEGERALALDSTVVDAYVALGNVSMFYDMDWAAAERALGRALELDPRSVEARAAKVSLLYYIGRFGDAVKEAREELWLQTRTEQPKIELARALFFDRQYAAAGEQLTQVLERDSSRFRAHLLLGEVLAQRAKYDSAIFEMQAALRNLRTSRTQAYLAYVYARAGRWVEAQRELSAMYEKSRHDFVPAFDFAIAYAGFGKMDSTFAWLNKSVDDHTVRPYLMDPTFDSIRSDSGYRQLLRRMNLPYPAAR
jgi:tetratricopeptide (TPR) repeat protein